MEFVNSVSLKPFDPLALAESVTIGINDQRVPLINYNTFNAFAKICWDSGLFRPDQERVLQRRGRRKDKKRKLKQRK